MSSAYQAMMFARQVHHGRRCRYTGGPYVDHLAKVAGIAGSVSGATWGLSRDYVVAASWLRHCIGDPGVAFETLVLHFGAEFVDGLRLLAELESDDEVQHLRKARDRLGRAPQWIQHVICAEIAAEASSIAAHDPTNAKAYMQEARELLAVLTQADRQLWELARSSAAMA